MDIFINYIEPNNNVSNNSIPKLYENGYYTPLGRDVISAFINKIINVNKDWRFTPYQRLQFSLKDFLKDGYSFNHIQSTLIDVVNSFKGLYIENNVLKNGKSLALLPVYRHLLTFKQYINLVNKYGKNDTVNKFIWYLTRFIPYKLIEDIKSSEAISTINQIYNIQDTQVLNQVEQVGNTVDLLDWIYTNDYNSNSLFTSDIESYVNREGIGVEYMCLTIDELKTKPEYAELIEYDDDVQYPWEGDITEEAPEDMLIELPVIFGEHLNHFSDEHIKKAKKI